MSELENIIQDEVEKMENVYSGEEKHGIHFIFFLISILFSY